MALATEQTGSESDGYSALDRSPRAVWRSRIHETRHLGAIRLESYHVSKLARVYETCADMKVISDDQA